MPEPDSHPATPADPAPPSAGTPVEPHSATPSTWTSPRAWILLLLVTAVGLTLDLWSKDWAFRTVAGTPVELVREDVLAGKIVIPYHSPQVVLEGFLEFTLVLNPGAIFGVGEGQRAVFIAVTLFAIGFGLWIFKYWTRPGDWLAHVGIGLLLSGGVGNLYDRVVYGRVRDFIHPLPHRLLPMGWHWPGGAHSDELWPYVSNVADKLLLLGIVLLFVHAWRGGKASNPSSPT